MPPSARKPAAKADEKADRNRDGICLRCWPDGWPSDDTTNANCEHGTWQR